MSSIPLLYEQENSIRDGQIIMDDQLEERWRMEDEEMRMLEQDDLIRNGRLVLDEIMKEELRIVEEDQRMPEEELMVMEVENSIMDGQSVMDENERMKQVRSKAGQELRFKGEDLMAMKPKLRREDGSTIFKTKQMKAEGLLVDEKSIISTGEPQNEFTQIYEEWMMRKEKQSAERRPLRRERERKRMAEEELWRSKEVMMDGTAMTEEPIMDEEWTVMVDEILRGERRAMMREFWKLREQSIKNEKSIMNEEWTTMVDEIMDGERRAMMQDMMSWEELMDEDMESSMREDDMMDEELLMHKELMMDEEVLTIDQLLAINEKAKGYHHATGNEESMDYEQGIMDENHEMLGSHLTPPVAEERQSTFAYNALDQPKHHIRAIRLSPRRWRTDPMIICDIITLDLRTGPWYEALSYEWGSPSTTKRYTIRLNGQSMVVRENLWWALYELRDAHHSRTLWIDAICINQADVHERNCQVSRMGDIYSQAARVVAWIGQANYGSGHIFLSQLGISAESFLRSGSRCRPWQHRCKWQALGSLCSRSYWSRLWIIQEVLLASELYIQCGSLSFQWEELSNVFYYLRQRSTAICPSWTKLSVVLSVPFRLDMRRNKHQLAVLAKNKDDRMPLLDLVDLFKSASCFDDRDKIFGLRGLSLSCCKDAVKADYSMDREGVINALLGHHEAQHP